MAFLSKGSNGRGLTAASFRTSVRYSQGVVLTDWVALKPGYVRCVGGTPDTRLCRTFSQGVCNNGTGIGVLLLSGGGVDGCLFVIDTLLII